MPYTLQDLKQDHPDHFADDVCTVFGKDLLNPTEVDRSNFDVILDSLIDFDEVETQRYHWYAAIYVREDKLAGNEALRLEIHRTLKWLDHHELMDESHYSNLLWEGALNDVCEAAPLEVSELLDIEADTDLDRWCESNAENILLNFRNEDKEIQWERVAALYKEEISAHPR